MHISDFSDVDAFDKLSVPERRKVWEETFSIRDRKRMTELRAFKGFLDASGLHVDSSSVTCMDPPSPDIRCRLGSSPYFFELGEVIDAELASRHSQSHKTGMITGGAFSQNEPLDRLLTSKGKKTYRTDGAPTDLVLYYWEQAPPLEGAWDVLLRLRLVTDRIFSCGNFSRIWIYDHSFQACFGPLTASK